jgi:ATP dependent DNA ligase-like protein
VAQPSAHAQSSMREAAASWRPMAYGHQPFYKIADPICEPLWGGRRVLVQVAAGQVDLRGTDGAEVEGYDVLREAIADAIFADELVIDGSLLPAPLRDTEGARIRVGMDAVKSPTDRVRHIFIGESPLTGKREALAVADEARLPSPGDEPAALVATDLLWIDGQSLLDVPLLERKRVLESAVDERELVRRSMVVRPPVESWFAQWRALGFEEVTYKAANGRYRPGTVAQDWTVIVMPRR